MSKDEALEMYEQSVDQAWIGYTTLVAEAERLLAARLDAGGK